MLSVAEGSVARLAHHSPVAAPGIKLLGNVCVVLQCDAPAPARPVLMASLRVNYS